MTTAVPPGSSSAAARRSARPRVDEVLEHVGGDHAVEAAEPAGVASAVADVGADDAVEPPLGVARVVRVELDADDLGALALLERRAQLARRAAEVQDRAGRRPARAPGRPGAGVS